MTDGLRLDVTLSPSKEATVTVAGKKTAAVSEEERVDAITVALWDVSALKIAIPGLSEAHISARKRTS